MAVSQQSHIAPYSLMSYFCPLFLHYFPDPGPRDQRAGLSAEWHQGCMPTFVLALEKTSRSYSQPLAFQNLPPRMIPEFPKGPDSYGLFQANQGHRLSKSSRKSHLLQGG